MYFFSVWFLFFSHILSAVWLNSSKCLPNIHQHQQMKILTLWTLYIVQYQMIFSTKHSLFEICTLSSFFLFHTAVILFFSIFFCLVASESSLFSSCPTHQWKKCWHRRCGAENVNFSFFFYKKNIFGKSC